MRAPHVRQASPQPPRALGTLAPAGPSASPGGASESRVEKGGVFYFLLVHLTDALWLRRKNTHLQCRRFLFDPWVGKTPEKEMAAHSSTLACRIPWTEEPVELQSTGSQSRT